MTEKTMGEGDRQSARNYNESAREFIGTDAARRARNEVRRSSAPDRLTPAERSARARALDTETDTGSIAKSTTEEETMQDSRTETTPEAQTEEALATHRVADAAHAAIDEAASRAEPIELKVRDKARGANRELEARQEATYESIQQSIDKTEAFVKEKPLFAAGAAFAAGILASALLRR